MKTASDEDCGGDSRHRDVYDGGGDAVRQQKRCGMTEMEKWVGRTTADWEKYQQGTTNNLRAHRRSNDLCVGKTTDLHGDLGCIWRLCVSYCNLNKITR